MRARTYTACFVLALLGAITGGLVVGAFDDPPPSLVQCQEDELWYPADFDPPTAAADLACVHIDTIMALDDDEVTP